MTSPGHKKGPPPKKSLIPLDRTYLVCLQFAVRHVEGKKLTHATGIPLNVLSKIANSGMCSAEEQEALQNIRQIVEDDAGQNTPEPA